MGYLSAGLFGEVRNKIGGVIFSNWKGINTAREYKVPANPQSVAQTAQRTKFAAVVSLAQALLATLIVTYWNPFAVKMSGFNAFIKSVFPNVSSTGIITASCLVTQGTLESAPIVGTPTYTSGSGVVAATLDDTVYGNGDTDDYVCIVCIDNTDNTVLGYNFGNTSRGDATAQITIATGLTAAEITAFVFLYRGTGSSFIVSDSVGSNCAAA